MAFVARLTKDGIYQNQWYYGSNPFHLSGYSLPNCTCYAYGRAAEIAGQFLNLPLGDAGTWYNTVTGFNKGSTPQIGAIGVWRSRSGNYSGHVAVVEEVGQDGSVLFSCSGYNRPIYQYPPDTPSYFWTERVYPSVTMLMNYMYSRDYEFQGYIYNPYATPPTEILPQWIYSNSQLTQSEMENNALVVWQFLSLRNWNRQAVAGALANMEYFSTINPDYTGTGYGLVQWNPPSFYTDWAAAQGYANYDGDGQLTWIDEQTVIQNYWNPYDSGISFDMYKTLNATATACGILFLSCFMKEPRTPQLEADIESLSTKWYNFIATNDPANPQPGGPQDKAKKNMPLWMMLRYW